MDCATITSRKGHYLSFPPSSVTFLPSIFLFEANTTSESDLLYSSHMVRHGNFSRKLSTPVGMSGRVVDSKHILVQTLRFEHSTSDLYILYPVVVSIIFNTYCCLWIPMVTTVQIDDDLKKRLNLLKIHPRESYNDLIARLIDCYSPETASRD